MRALFVAMLLLPCAAQAELSFWGGLGGAWSHSSDLHLQAGGADLRFDDVAWKKEPFSSPPYYALRVAYVPKRTFGFFVEFVHDKVFADLDARVRVTGQRAGAQVAGTERLGDTFEELSMSHGLNLLAAGVLARWARCEAPPCAGLEPYVFASGGPLIPHVEVKLDGKQIGEYQLGGFGLSGGVGAAFAPIRWVAVFGEYRFTWARPDVRVPQGTLQTEVSTHQLVFGLTARAPL